MASKSSPIVPLLSLSAVVVVLSAGLIIIQHQSPSPVVQAATNTAPVSPFVGTYKASSSTKPVQVTFNSDGSTVVTTWVSQQALTQTGTWSTKAEVLTLTLSSESVTFAPHPTGLKTTKYSSLFGSAGLVLTRVN